MSYKKLYNYWGKDSSESDENIIENCRNFDCDHLRKNNLKDLTPQHLNALEYLYQQAENKLNGQNLIEGNLYTSHLTKKRYPEGKIKRLGEMAKYINSFMEIGVNAGHSSLQILQNNPSIERILLFDINTHPYVENAVNILRERFPRTSITLILGDSTKTILNFNMNEKYDLIHIDGGHSKKVAYADIINSKKFAHQNTILVIDDCRYNDRNKCLGGAVKDALSNNIINIICAEDTIGNDPHLICRYK